MFEGKHYYHVLGLLATQALLLICNYFFLLTIYFSLCRLFMSGFSQVHAADWALIGVIVACSITGPALVFACIGYCARDMQSDGAKAVRNDLRAGACLRDVPFSAADVKRALGFHTGRLANFTIVTMAMALICGFAMESCNTSWLGSYHPDYHYFN